MKTFARLAAAVACLSISYSTFAEDPPPAPKYQVENLGRGVIALRTSDTAVYVGWRLLGTDPGDLAFNVYRATGGGDPVRVNATPLGLTTDLVDTGADLAQANSYTVRPILRGVELSASAPFVLAANAPSQQYLSVPLQRPVGGNVEVPEGNPTQAVTYSPNDASVADLDGDGEYEIVLKWDPSNARDNASAGLAGRQLIDAYRLDGTLLWRIDLGRNIRAGAHYTQFMVYDLDGDGRAEVACKTADGTVDGVGTVIGDATRDYRSLLVPTDGILATATNDQRYGKVLAGPEYFTIFDGLTGKALATTNYLPSRDPIDGWGGIGGNGNNDNTGNRGDRFLAGIAYLDGERPSVVMARGYYGRTVLAAWDYRNGLLTSRWVFDSGRSVGTGFPWTGSNPFNGQGDHALSVADVDHDGKDEIIYGAMVVDDNGVGLFSTGLRHGDALHVGDLVPSRPGLEVYGVHESEGNTLTLNTPGMALYDAATGQIIWSFVPGRDVGRGMEADIDPRTPGDEFWGATEVGLLDGQGNRVADAPSSVNHAVWWDADALREIEDANWISKWDWNTSTLTRLLTADGAASNNGTKQNATLTGDILGDWREEVIWRAADNASLRIYSTTIPATNRMFTLMHDPQYRVAIAWQNVGYNQPPHPSFFIGDGMTAPPAPNIVHADTQAPAFRRLFPSRHTLWPANERLMPVSIRADLVDLLDAMPKARIVSVTSDEAEEHGRRQRHDPADYKIIAPLIVLLRAERNDHGRGRVYTIGVEGRDAAGNTVQKSVEVRVAPKHGHGRGHRGH
ncbi:MAG TPA: rhamnogalacturonan lyase [Steroidobacteraceae bacterium]|jgi:rhamnogalacturonan endolyase|nr:rhamnogalacturonan lyase [Steroidobacteraceae bacterium]